METLTHTTQTEQLTLPEWETPVITHLEIKMTLMGSAGIFDGAGMSPTFVP